MVALTAVVVALSIAVATNFILLLAVVRRLRLQRPAPPVVDLPRIGMQAPAFTVQDASGEPVDDSFYIEHRDAVIAFFSDNCKPCQQVKTELAHDPIRDPFLAFVQTADGGAEQVEFAAELAQTGARTVLLEPGSDIPRRFAVSAFPTLMRLQNGIVVASSIKLAEVRAAVEQAGAETGARRRTEAGGREGRSSRLVKR